MSPRTPGTGRAAGRAGLDRAGAPLPVPPPPLELERLYHELQVHQEELLQQNEELRSAQADVEAGLRRYTDLYEFAPVAYLTLAPGGVIMDVNLTGATLLGVPRPVLRGQPLRRFTVPAGAARFDRFLASVLRGDQTGAVEVDLVAGDGTARSGQSVGVLDPVDGTCRLAILDVTAQRRAEEALRVVAARLVDSQRLEAIGRLAGGVAHDFNNMLMAINGTAELLAASLPEDDPRQSDVKAIRESGEHAASLARQLLAFGRRQTLRPVALSLYEAVTGIAPLLRRTLGEDVLLELDLAASVPPVSVDPVQLEQVVVNLAFNARDAMPDGGRLTLTLTDLDAPPSMVKAYPSVSPGHFARLAVTDTGTGIEPALLPHLFEPFYTTKPMGHGTGLGLATVEGVVAQSGGWVEVSSVIGQGSTFSVFLPCAAGPGCEGVAEAADSDVLVGGSESLLLVEDEAAVRLVAARMLRTLGYRVIDLPNPELALALDPVTLADIDVLITDVVMPGMNGDRLAAVLEGRRPGLSVIFVSGFSPDAVLHDRLRQPGATFLAKPFTRPELAAAVRRAVEDA